MCHRRACSGMQAPWFHEMHSWVSGEGVLRRGCLAAALLEGGASGASAQLLAKWSAS